MKLDTVLAAVDPDDDLAEAVVLAASDLARRDGAAFHVVSAWPILSASAVAGAPELEAGLLAGTEDVYEADKAARADHERVLQALARARDPNATVRMLLGDAAEVVTRYAREIGADLIVAGSHQKGVWSRLFAGPGSAALIRGAPCAVFLVTRPFAEKLLGKKAEG